MKFRVGQKVVGEVPNEKVANHKPRLSVYSSPTVAELVIESICNGLRRFQHLPGAREKFLEALGVTDGRSKPVKGHRGEQRKDGG